MLRWDFLDSKLSMVYVNGACYILLIVETLPRESVMAQVMSFPSAFEICLYFCARMFLEEYMQTKWVSTVRGYNNDMRLINAVMLVIKTWNVCMRAVGQGSIQIVL